ncbi:MAG: N-acetyl-gamma-glutamyl-phosphate reductase [Candidatus Omnitrophica bacterium]|nr:N-acetyl-gamma-glutamyl-phosphate reductase [Candidatus Omnitrophota bacterium]
MINVGIIGATGYVGEELVGLLLNHPQVKLTNISSRSSGGELFSDLAPQFKGRTTLACDKPDIKKICAKSDLVFLALPHTASMDFVPQLLQAGKRVIDLSADYRIKETPVYEKFYAVKHKDKANIKDAVYGLPEIYKAKIKTAKLIANPGCYPTVSILSIAPLVATGLADIKSIIIDAKSGVTGAGKKLAEGFLFSEVNEDFKAYKVNAHQHGPEIDQEISKLAGKKIHATFVPHLLPVSRGILATVYIKKAKMVEGKTKNLIELYKRFYKDEPFVRIRKPGDFPRLKDVVHTNFCDIGIQEDNESVIVIAAIDNLLKGAAGQAVQNMNIMNKFPEESALL